MALKAVLDKAGHDALDDTTKALYKQEGEKFYLDLESLDEHVSVRNLSTALQRERQEKGSIAAQLAEQRAKYEGIDSDAAREALRKIGELERQTEEGDIPERFKAQFDKAVEARIKALNDEYSGKERQLQRQIEQFKTENATLGKRMEELTIDGAVRDAAVKAGLHEWAVEDAVLHARSTYRLDKDGRPVPYKGNEIIYGKDAQNPKPIDEWLSDKVKEKPGWVRESQGGGAENNRGSALRQDGRQMVISRDRAADSRAYAKAKEDAAKAGLELIIEQPR